MTDFILASITLNMETKEGCAALSMTFAFTHQPTVRDLMVAFDNTPSLTKRPDAPGVRAKLVQSLNTYGVPRFDQLRMIEPNGYKIDNPVLACDWYATCTGEETAVASYPVGKIVMYRKTLIDNNPEPQPPVPAKPPLVKPRKKVIPK